MTLAVGQMGGDAAGFRRYLAEAGLRRTRQRELVVGTFFSLGGHVSARDLHRETRKRGGRIGLATVYRVLKLLREAGLAEERRFTEDQTLFEPTPPRHHDHMICARCGTIAEFENAEIEALQEQVARRAGFRILWHKLELYGRCRACQPAR